MEDLQVLAVLEPELRFIGEKRIECVYRYLAGGGRFMWPENEVVMFGEDVQEYLMAGNRKIAKLVGSECELMVEPLEPW